jgi:hypothetical protein
MRPADTIPGMGERKIKNNGGGEFNYDVWYFARTFINATMYPQHNN